MIACIVCFVAGALCGYAVGLWDFCRLAMREVRP